MWLIFKKINLTHKLSPSRYYLSGGSGSNDSKGVLHIPQISRTGASPSDDI